VGAAAADEPARPGAEARLRELPEQAREACVVGARLKAERAGRGDDSLVGERGAHPTVEKMLRALVHRGRVARRFGSRGAERAHALAQALDREGLRLRQEPLRVLVADERAQEVGGVPAEVLPHVAARVEQQGEGV
jgi:hypothetical protein